MASAGKEGFAGGFADDHGQGRTPGDFLCLPAITGASGQPFSTAA
jgi:hypothetical protein